MNNPLDIRQFYDDHYRANNLKNPAFQIYDAIRVNTIRLFKGQHPGRILIAGCGSHLDFKILDPKDASAAFDLSIEAVKRVKGVQSTLFVGDALGIPLPSESFDMVICSEVLEHIPDVSHAVCEFERILKPGGTLIVSSPNWLSWFGITRWLAEIITRRRISSDDQPYDDWKTFWKYRKELDAGAGLQVVDCRGVWYLPPMHFRSKGLSRRWTEAVYRVFSPLDRFFSRHLPYFGHLLVIKCIKTADRLD